MYYQTTFISVTVSCPKTVQKHLHPSTVAQTNTQYHPRHLLWNWCKFNPNMVSVSVAIHEHPDM